MFLYDKIIQQISVQRDSEDPDPGAALMDLDVQALITTDGGADITKVREVEEKYRKQLEKAKRLEREMEGLSMCAFQVIVLNLFEKLADSSWHFCRITR
jgi:hypothetical protein